MCLPTKPGLSVEPEHQQTGSRSHKNHSVFCFFSLSLSIRLKYKTFFLTKHYTPTLPFPSLQLVISPPLHVTLELLAPSDWKPASVSRVTEKNKKYKAERKRMRFMQHVKALSLVWTSRCETKAVLFSTLHFRFNPLKSSQLNLISSWNVKVLIGNRWK